MAEVHDHPPRMGTPLLHTADQLAGQVSFTTAAQLRHRALLVGTWGIAPGSSLLEVGCGQGDTAMLLAESVGSNGRVVAVDSAPSEYGEPRSLGESHQEIQKLGLIKHSWNSPSSA